MLDRSLRNKITPVYVRYSLFSGFMNTFVFLIPHMQSGGLFLFPYRQHRWNPCMESLVAFSCYFLLKNSYQMQVNHTCLVPETSTLKRLFGEITLSQVKVWNHPTETTIKSLVVGGA